MSFADPSVWGLLAIAAAIVWAGTKNVQIVHAANMDRREDHRAMMEALNSLPDEFEQLKVKLDGIQANTAPPFTEADYD